MSRSSQDCDGLICLSNYLDKSVVIRFGIFVLFLKLEGKKKMSVDGVCLLKVFYIHTL